MTHKEIAKMMRATGKDFWNLGAGHSLKDFGKDGIWLCWDENEKLHRVA